MARYIYGQALQWACPDHLLSGNLTVWQVYNVTISDHCTKCFAQAQSGRMRLRKFSNEGHNEACIFHYFQQVRVLEQMTPHLVVSQLGSCTTAIIISHQPSQHTEAGLDHPGLSFAAIPYKASAPLG